MNREPSLHHRALRAFLAGAKAHVRAANVLKRRFGYSDQQLRVMAAANQRGVQNYGSRPRVEAMAQLGASMYRAKQAMARRLGVA